MPQPASRDGKRDSDPPCVPRKDTRAVARDENLQAACGRGCTPRQPLSQPPTMTHLTASGMTTSTLDDACVVRSASCGPQTGFAATS